MGKRKHFADGQRERIFKRDGGKCRICGVKVGNRPKDRAWEIHHINGDASMSEDWNLEVRCVFCHNRAHPDRWNSPYNSLITNAERKAYKNGDLARRDQFKDYAHRVNFSRVNRMRQEP